MDSEHIVSPAMPTLAPEDTADRALALMEDNKLSHIPVVAADNYIGLVSENELLDLPDPGAPLTQTDLLHYRPAILGGAHPFDAFRLMHDMNLSALPVIDRDHKYIGCITREGLIKYMTENSGFNMPGGIVVLEIAPRNYTMVEIARICENEDVTIVNTMVRPNDAGMLEVTLKLNRTSIEVVVSSFERHGYHVKEEYGADHLDDDVTEKYHLLMNYIKM
jgi:CBS domain-containing protein